MLYATEKSEFRQLGGNSGIGLETASALAGQGYKTVIGCRDSNKAKDTVETIQKRHPNGKVETRILDLADFQSIHQFAKEVTSENDQIDVLVNNAGVMACPPMKTKDGLEMQIGVNHFGHFLLTSLLYDKMKGHEEPARIVNVSSSAYQFGKMNFEDINYDKNYTRWGAYGQSKLANILFTYELARRIPTEDNVRTTVLHPGVVATGLPRYLLPEKPNVVLKPFLSLFNWLIKTPAQGAETSIYLASSPEVKDVTGKYFVDCKETKSKDPTYNEEDAKKLWELSNSITNASWPF